MSSNRNHLEVKAVKTAALLAAVNCGVSTVVDTESSGGILLLVMANVFSIYKLHELGEKRRPGSNMLTTIGGLFASPRERDEQEVDNACRNIINGGAAVADIAVETVSKILRKFF